MVGMGDWCIDSTEVTELQYYEFVTAKANDMSGQLGQCVNNTSYLPASGCKPNWDPFSRPNRAMTCVDWCDAYAYCGWAGKRLCGKIGAGGIEYDDVGNPALSEWAYACSNGGTTTYPYGNVEDKDACKYYSAFYPAYGVVDVQSMPLCRGLADPFSQLWDLVGNAGEWIQDSYGAYGISHTYVGAKGDKLYTCSSRTTSSGAMAYIGFRCCK
jgi:formylglycine-generating enzyme